MMVERLSAWRAEIMGEIGETEAALAAAVVAAAEAEDQRRAAQSGWRSFKAKFERLSGPISLAVASRLGEGEREVRTADHAVTRAQVSVTNLRAKLADLQQAILELDRITRAEQDEADQPELARAEP